MIPRRHCRGSCVTCVEMHSLASLLPIHRNSVLLPVATGNILLYPRLRSPYRGLDCRNANTNRTANYCISIDPHRILRAGGERSRTSWTALVSTGCVDLPDVGGPVQLRLPRAHSVEQSAISSLSVNTFQRRLKTHLFGQS